MRMLRHTFRGWLLQMAMADGLRRLVRLTQVSGIVHAGVPCQLKRHRRPLSVCEKLINTEISIIRLNKQH